MATITLQRGEVEEVNYVIADEPMEVVSVTCLIDGNPQFSLKWLVAADDAVILDHMHSEARRRGLI